MIENSMRNTAQAQSWRRNDKRIAEAEKEPPIAQAIMT